MATSNAPTEAIADLLDSDALPLGEYAAREDGNGVKTTYPEFARKANNVDSNSKFKKYYDPDTGATITVPVDQQEE